LNFDAHVSRATHKGLSILRTSQRSAKIAQSVSLVETVAGNAPRLLLALNNHHPVNPKGGEAVRRG
jgi:hypothetical protein